MTDTDDHHPPDVLEAYWDRDRVAALFADLEQRAEVRHVRVRTASGNNRPEDSAVTLEQARELLNDNLAKAIQIYYEYDGESWCDTLMPSPNSIHVIRTNVPPER
jgi:hypothetical protein